MRDRGSRLIGRGGQRHTEAANKSDQHEEIGLTAWLAAIDDEARS